MEVKMYYKIFIVLLSMVLIVSLLPLNADAQEWVSFSRSITPEKPSWFLWTQYLFLKRPQNYPNTFTPPTTIKFQLPKASNVTLVIYDIQGQEVVRLVDGYVEAGYHSIPWKPGSSASGIYIYRLQAGSFSATNRMLYIK